MRRPSSAVKSKQLTKAYAAKTYVRPVTYSLATFYALKFASFIEPT